MELMLIVVGAVIVHHLVVVRPLIKTISHMRYVGFNVEPPPLPDSPTRPEIRED